MEPKHKNKNNTQELKISVKDDGIGIKTQDQNKIF